MPLSFQGLSKRENEVAELLIEGKINKEIGDVLGISERTVKGHRALIFKKLGIKSVVELARLVDKFGSPFAYPMKWRTDAAGACVWVSDELIEFLGRTKQDGDDWDDAIHPKNSRKAIEEAWQKAWYSKSNFSFAHQVKRADGEYRWVLDIGVASFNDSGEYVGHRGVMIEIDKYMGYWAQLISQDRATTWGDAVKLILAFLGFGLLTFASDRYQSSVKTSGERPLQGNLTDYYLPEDYSYI
jgi:DNA-binding CsgD family transcriptional regulator